MPSDNGFRFDKQQDIGPARPEAATSGPKQPIAKVHGGRGLLRLSTVNC
jgi:hypothetical protein